MTTSTGQRRVVRAAWTAGMVVNLAAAAAIVFVYRIGPTVLTLTATHGVHSGDALAVLPALAAAWCATRARRR